MLEQLHISDEKRIHQLKQKARKQHKKNKLAKQARRKQR